MKSNHKYRATIYLGKEIFEEVQKMAEVFGMSVSQLTGVMFRTGYDFSKQLDRNEVSKDGK